MRTAYSFIRWSSKRQGDVDRDSFERQTKSAREWCDENGYSLSKEVFIGKGESAYKGKHLKVKDGVALGALARFIQAVETGDIKSPAVLLIDSVDRFQRQEIMKALAPFTTLLNLGIGIVFTGSYHKKLLTNDLLNKEPHWLQVVINDMIRSWMESDEKSRKVKSGLKRRLEKVLKGETTYNRAPKYFSHDGSRYQPNSHAKTVVEMAKMVINGSSLYAIAREFNAKKVPTLRRDSMWSTTTIRGVLKSRTLIGELFGKKNYFPHVLDDSTFNQVQVILRQNSSFNRGRVAAFVNIWRGLAYCRCGAAMNTINQGKNPATGQPYPDPTKYRYFRCTSKSIGKGCQYHGAIKLTRMETEFFGNFILQDPRALAADKTESKALNGKVSVVQAEIAALDKQIAKLVTLSDEMDVPELKAKLQELTVKRDGKKSELDNLNSHLSKLQLSPGHFDDLRQLFADVEKNAMHRKHFMDGDGYIPFQLLVAGVKLNAAMVRLQEALKDNKLRNRIKTLLPSLVGRVEVDPAKKTWTVKNHSGKVVYESLSHEFY